jgi:hypothetical protein
MKPSYSMPRPAVKEAVLSLAQLLVEQPDSPPPGWIEPGLLPPQGILFVGGEPKVGKSLLVANLALALAAGKDRAGFRIPAARRVLVCQFELPTPQFVARLASMRRSVGAAADQNLLVDTRAIAPQGLNHFLNAARQAAAEVIVLDPLSSTHDGAVSKPAAAARCIQSGAHRGASRPQIDRPRRDRQRLPRFLRPACRRRLLPLADAPVGASAAARKKVEPEHVTRALAGLGQQARDNQLREQVMDLADCSRRTAQLAIAEACRQGSIVQVEGQYRLPS